jgi:chromosomal replication initiator protein
VVTLDLRELHKSIVAEITAPSEKALMEQIELSEKNGGILIFCPSLFMQQYIQKQYKELIARCIRSSAGSPVDIDFLVCTRKERRNALVVQKPVQMVLPPSSTIGSASGLNPRFTFEDFVVGKCNAFAYEAAIAVSQEESSRYNPLYFYSDIGLGKSHIAHAIGNRVIRSKPKLSIRYTTARDFSQEYVYAIRNNCLDKFKHAYQGSKLDIFFIDDVHLFGNKEKTQMELACVLDDLSCSGTQIVLSGFRPPSSMPHIDTGLKSRFTSGLVINIKRPDKDTRAAIVRYKANREGIILKEDVVEFVSDNITTNIRELESAVLTISAMSSLMKREITLALAKEILEGTLEKQARIDIQYIQDFVAKNFGITKESLVSSSRKKGIIYPRQVAIFLCRRYTKESLQTIGQAFSRKHTSVIHTIEVIDTQYTHNLKTKKEIDFLIERLDSQF